MGLVTNNRGSGAAVAEKCLALDLAHVPRRFFGVAFGLRETPRFFGPAGGGQLRALHGSQSGPRGSPQTPNPPLGSYSFHIVRRISQGWVRVRGLRVEIYLLLASPRLARARHYRCPGHPRRETVFHANDTGPSPPFAGLRVPALELLVTLKNIRSSRVEPLRIDPGLCISLCPWRLLGFSRISRTGLDVARGLAEAKGSLNAAVLGASGTARALRSLSLSAPFCRRPYGCPILSSLPLRCVDSPWKKETQVKAAAGLICFARGNRGKRIRKELCIPDGQRSRGRVSYVQLYTPLVTVGSV